MPPFRNVLIPTALLAALLAGCAAKQTEPDFCRLDGYSGFLNDYSRLEPSPTHPGAWYEQWTDLSTYNTFIVDPVQMLATTTLRGDPVTPEIAADLTGSLRTELVQTLQLSGFTIATEPGPGIARIRAAITELAKSRRVSGRETEIGGATAEVEITDSVSGKRVGAAVERDEVDSIEVGASRDPYNDARLVFRHWAARFGLWMQRQHQ